VASVSRSDSAREQLSGYDLSGKWNYSRIALPVQMVDATLACSLLAGVSKPKVFLGR
jgi:hypothetical protein